MFTGVLGNGASELLNQEPTEQPIGNVVKDNDTLPSLARDSYDLLKNASAKEKAKRARSHDISKKKLDLK